METMWPFSVSILGKGKFPYKEREPINFPAVAGLQTVLPLARAEDRPEQLGKL